VTTKKRFMGIGPQAGQRSERLRPNFGRLEEDAHRPTGIFHMGFPDNPVWVFRGLKNCG